MERLAELLGYAVMLVCLVVGFAVGWITGPVMMPRQCDCQCNQAELKPLDEDGFEHLKISVLVEKLKAQIDRLERRRDAGQEAVGMEAGE